MSNSWQLSKIAKQTKKNYTSNLAQKTITVQGMTDWRQFVETNKNPATIANRIKFQNEINVKCNF